MHINLREFRIKMMNSNEEQHHNQRRYSDTEESVIRFQRRFFGDDAEISHDKNNALQKARSTSDESFFQRRKNKKRRIMSIPQAPSPHHIEVACAEGYAKYFEPIDTDLVQKSQHELVHHSYTNPTQMQSNFTTQRAMLDLSTIPPQGHSYDNTLMTQHEQKPLLSNLSFEEQQEIASAIHESLNSTQFETSNQLNDGLASNEIKDRLALSRPKHSKDQMPSNVKSSSPSYGLDSETQSTRFKPFHEKKWNQQLEELRSFKRKYGHCLVPHTFDENPHLARWVKRQRRQYKLLLEGNTASTMTQERVEILTKEGFIWDSHEVVWMERYNQLVTFMSTHGHCRVPVQNSQFPQLPSWIKCQRRQYKLLRQGKPSSLTEERVMLLNNIGFSWEVRAPAEKKPRSTPETPGSK